MDRRPGRWTFALLCCLAVRAAAAGADAPKAASTEPQAPGAPAVAAAIAELVAANRILADQQILDAYGHVSVRHPADAKRFLLSRNLAPALVGAADVLEYDLDGSAAGAPPGTAHFLERFIHAELYRARPDVKAVIHAHSPAVIPFADSATPLRPMSILAAFLGAGAPVFDVREAAGGPSNLLVGSPPLGRALAERLGGGAVVLLRGHGDVVVAGSLPLAVFRAVYAEANARVQLQAAALGGPIRFLAPDEAALADKVLDQIHLRAWELWKQKAAAR